MRLDKALPLLFIGNPSEYTQQPVIVTPCKVSRKHEERKQQNSFPMNNT